MDAKYCLLNWKITCVPREPTKGREGFTQPEWGTSESLFTNEKVSTAHCSEDDSIVQNFINEKVKAKKRALDRILPTLNDCSASNVRTRRFRLKDISPIGSEWVTAHTYHHLYKPIAESVELKRDGGIIYVNTYTSALDVGDYASWKVQCATGKCEATITDVLHKKAGTSYNELFDVGEHIRLFEEVMQQYGIPVDVPNVVLAKEHGIFRIDQS